MTQMRPEDYPPISVLDPDPNPSEVYCSRCDQPTHRELIITTGESRAYCLVHYGEAMRVTYGR